MARISDEEIERIKKEVSLQRLVESSGVELKKHGNDYIGLCPFHDDKEPSLIVSPGKNLWHCLGACQSGGSVIDWVMRKNYVSFRHAVELLIADSPHEVTASMVGSQSTAFFKPGFSDTELFRKIVDYYHETLKKSGIALDYLKGRGLEGAEYIDHFKIGYADRSLAYRLPQNHKKELREQLQRIGILRESGHEHFNGSIVIPIFATNGDVVGMYGRKVLQNLRPGTLKHLYLPGSRKGIFNYFFLAANKPSEIILCEALIDALTFWSAGFKNVTASYGVGGFTEEHLRFFKESGVKRILIAYDRDEAGDLASEKLSEKLTAEGIECFRILFPKGMDANEYAKQVKPAAKSLSLVIRKAEWMKSGEKAEKSPEVVLLNNLAAEEKEEETVDEIPIAPSAPIIPEPSMVSPVPEIAKDIEAEVKEQEIVMYFGDRRYRVRGFSKNIGFEQLKINLLCSMGDRFHVDSLELYSARHRAAFIKQTASELGVTEQVIKEDLGKVLLKLETLQDEQAKKKPKKPEIEISDAEKEEALKLLKSDDLLQQILDDFKASGIVGEEMNKLVGYLACVSRKLESPLAIVIQSSSAAGKSSLMDAILNFVPSEDRIQYSAMTGQSLFYVGKTDLKNKILAIAEEEGASQASYALKLLQSEGELTIASTGKDPATGKLITHEYHVEGPVMMFLTTTAIEVNEELLNRSIVLAVNESREQTQAIHQHQRSSQTLSGLLAGREKSDITRKHQNAQRLLKPFLVANPYAEELTFLDDRTRTRRDHTKYLTLIRSIALLHQYQREIKTVKHHGQKVQYLEVTKKDIETANKLAHEVLGRTLDELPPQTRNLLGKITAFVETECLKKAIKKSEYRFTRRKIREITGWGNTQLKMHLHRLADLEYILVHSGGRGQSYEYELLYNNEGDSKRSFLMGLIDSNSLKYDANQSGLKDEKSGSGRGSVGVWSAGCRDNENGSESLSGAPFTALELETIKKTYVGDNQEIIPY